MKVSMDDKEKQRLSETDICDLFITPAIKQVGWDPLQQIRREVTLTPDPVVVCGNMCQRRPKMPPFHRFEMSGFQRFQLG